MPYEISLSAEDYALCSKLKSMKFSGMAEAPGRYPCRSQR